MRETASPLLSLQAGADGSSVLSRCWVTVFFSFFFFFLNYGGREERGAPCAAPRMFRVLKTGGWGPLGRPSQAPPTAQDHAPVPIPAPRLRALPESCGLKKIFSNMVSPGPVFGLVLLIIARVSRSAGEVSQLCRTFAFQILCRILACVPSKGLV